MTNLDSNMLTRYVDMLVQQSYSNEEKAGSNADSVASKIEYLKPQILTDCKIVESLKTKIKEIENCNKYHQSQGCGTSVIQSKPFLDLLQSILDESKCKHDDCETVDGLAGNRMYICKKCGLQEIDD